MHTSPETTTSDDSDGTLVGTSTSPTPTQSLSGEGESDSTEGHSHLLVGTLPLTDKDPPSSSPIEGLASDLPGDKRLPTTSTSDKLE